MNRATIHYPDKSHSCKPTNIISWNINDTCDKTCGDKTLTPDFAEIMKSCQIFCLQETKKEVQFSEYICFNQTRKSSRSGGVCIGIHRSLEKYIKQQKTGDEDIAAITLSRKYSGMDKDLLIVNVYDSPENSSYKKRINEDGTNPSTLENLLDFLGNQRDCEVLLAGDLNARTGNLNFVCQNEDWADHTETNTCTGSRSSKDIVLNERGKRLLDLISCSNLSFLNGCTIGDVIGEFTCLRYNGSSVVDYIATSHNLRKQIRKFTVMPFTNLSDHRPIMCSIDMENEPVQRAETIAKQYRDTPPRPTWSPTTSPTVFRLEATLNPTVSTEIQDATNLECKTVDDVLELNSKISKTVKTICENIETSNNSGSVHNKRKSRRNYLRPKHRWFDKECMFAKRELNRLAKLYGKDPKDVDLRETYYSKRKAYRKLIKHKKGDHLRTINEEIMKNNEISWDKVKELKATKPEKSTLDIFDMINFYRFFKELYKEQPLTKEAADKMRSHKKQKKGSDIQNSTISDLSEILNKHITVEELTTSLKKLKNGKASGIDGITNEALKASPLNLQKALTKLFNECLDKGIYPWNQTVISPLHKKGDINNPDNYRAIAVGSNMGKLFSSILLQRLLQFRQLSCPDTENQLGFCQEAQTVDHVYTLNTCIEKQVRKLKKRLYTCFVDFRKAFDLLNRSALLYKLSELGVDGNFFKCISYMYTHSCASIKMVKKLSDTFDVLAGTEQGHPMSPELFKIYIHALSTRLNSLSDINVPLLNNVPVTHLFWADDLVLIATDKNSLQKMIDELKKYCDIWNLVVNIEKTAVMVFNSSGRQLIESHSFNYGDTKIPSTKEYCYLGMKFSLSGSWKPTQLMLRQKGLRAYFGLKSYIDTRSVSKKAMFKLFDCLILPVASYGHQIWLPFTDTVKNLLLANPTEADGRNYSTKQIACDPIERLHLSVLKWTLGIPKRTSNAGVWGDSGRPPLVVKLLKHTTDYLNKLILLDKGDSSKLVRHAFVEQRNLNLSWFNNINSMTLLLDPTSKGQRPAEKTPNALLCGNRGKDIFVETWKRECLQNKKLQFYSTIKKDFKLEPYIEECRHPESNLVARWRMSAHKLNQETGRYGQKAGSVHYKCCETCTDPGTIELLTALPGEWDPIIEDEVHVLRSCPRYNTIRQKLTEKTAELLDRDIASMFTAKHAKETGIYIKRLNEERFGSRKKST